TIDQRQLETRIEELRQLAGRLVEETAREQTESLQAEEAAPRHTAAEEQRAISMRAIERECAALEAQVMAASLAYQENSQRAQTLGAAARDAPPRLSAL